MATAPRKNTGNRSAATVQFEEKAKSVLKALWKRVEDLPLAELPTGSVSDAAYQVFEFREIGWKSSLIIQVAGKAADFDLDALCLQKGDGSAGTWEPREFAKRVFVPWHAGIGAPFGRSNDPYVNHVFRRPRFDEAMRAARRSPEMFDTVKGILEDVQRSATPEEVNDKLMLILAQLRRYMAGKTFKYPVPQRIGLDDTLKCVIEYVGESSGGARLQAIAHGLVLALQAKGLRYETVAVRHVNAADAATQSAGDVECFSEGKNVLTIEVKDRVLTVAELESSIDKARLANVHELLFFVHRSNGQTIERGAERQIEQIISSQFSLGLNIYIEQAKEFLRVSGTLLGEAGRKVFLLKVGDALEEQRADPKHRWAWSQAVRNIGQTGEP